MPRKKPDVKGLYYITHIDNLPSIIQNGIMAHRRVLDLKIPFTPIYDAEIVSNRQKKTVSRDKTLWDFANVYFQARNPMLYRVLHEKDKANIAVVAVQPAVLSIAGALVTTGNAASADTEILNSQEGQRQVFANWKVISSDWWNSVDGSKRKIMAECLVPDRVPPEYIHSIYVATPAVAENIRQMKLAREIPVIPEPNMFFWPAKQFRITDQLSLAEGDMFFSQMHTLTVSVNIVGIMGKGLASRAKYQFPDVYVAYQDACRSKALRMGIPYLYKREAFLDEELADEPKTLSGPNANKWFLLFATKNHWRDNADLDAIRKGVRWIRENYKREGIKSLALPALGCGLGNLDWKDVGPVICRELNGVDIPAAVYLPREHEISEEFLSPDFLLGKRSAA
jgi:O-acetyl-ADP-ribose deacetylase (regulator of RNase III)